MPDSSNPHFIFSYTRADALADGVLIDLTDIARDYGFKIPFAITSNLYRLKRSRTFLSSPRTSALPSVHKEFLSRKLILPIAKFKKFSH